MNDTPTRDPGESRSFALRLPTFPGDLGSDAAMPEMLQASSVVRSAATLLDWEQELSDIAPLTRTGTEAERDPYQKQAQNILEVNHYKQRLELQYPELTIRVRDTGTAESITETTPNLIVDLDIVQKPGDGTWTEEYIFPPETGSYVMETRPENGVGVPA